MLKLLTPYRPPNRVPRPNHLAPLKEEDYSFATASGQCDSDTNSDMSAPATPTEAHATLQSLLYRGVGGFGRDDEPQSIIYIDLLPNVTSIGSEVMRLPPVPSMPGYNVVRASQYPRRIEAIDPTVTLLASTTMVAKSHFTVRSRAGVIHSETTTMNLVGPVPEGADGELLYNTKLVPNFWLEICKSPDPTQYTIIQRVVQESSNDTSPLFSAAYQFTLPFPSGPNTQFSVPDSFPLDDALIQGSPPIGLGLDDLITLDSEAFKDLVVFDDKSMDLYDLNSCITTNWALHSPATSASSEAFSDMQQFEDGTLSAIHGLTDIPIIAL